MDTQNSNYANIELFQKAVKSGNIETVCTMLLENPSLSRSATPGNNFSSFWFAMVHGHTEIVELFVKFGADINECHSDDPHTKLTFFQWMAMNRDFSQQLESNKKIAEILLKHGADIDKTGDEIRTPLEIAIRHGNVACVQFLLKNKAKIEDPEVAIQLLVYINSSINTRINILLLLLEHGLDTGFHNEYGRNLLHIVSKTGKDHSSVVQIAKILFEAGVRLDELDNDGFSPLHLASEEPFNFELVTFFVKWGADVNTKRKSDGKSLLSLAVALNHRNHRDLVDLILSKGADVNAKDDSGRTALHEACQDEELIRLLFKKGANPGVYDEDENTPFAQLSSLDPEFYEEEPGPLHAMIKEFAKQSEFNSSFQIAELDNDVMSDRTELGSYYNYCREELSRMKRTVFFHPYSYLCVLKMSKNITKLAKLTKNYVFVREFEANLDKFSYFGDELRQIYDEALRIRNQAPIVYFRLRSVFGKGLLPNYVIWKVADHLTLRDLPM